MQNKNQQADEHVNTLKRTLFTARGITFSQDMDGYIHSSTLGQLGHEEDILKIGLQYMDVIDTLR